MPNLKPAVFLDRDGVMNIDRTDYVKNLGELIIFPFLAEALATLAKAGFELIVVSNQQGVPKGHILPEALDQITDALRTEAAKGGAEIKEFFYCRHLAAENCDCRKPKPGMILQAAEQRQIDLAASYMVGDNDRDLLAAEAAGCKPVLVLTGHTTPDMLGELKSKPAFVAKDLLEAAQWIVSDQTNQ